MLLAAHFLPVCLIRAGVSIHHTRRLFDVALHGFQLLTAVRFFDTVAERLVPSNRRSDAPTYFVPVV